MAKHLSNHDVESILCLLDRWEDRLTWDALCDASSKLVGKRPTRQSLNTHDDIKQAYLNKKLILKGEHHIEKRPSSLNSAAQRIKRLESENARLKSENMRLLEQFVVWQYNAYRYGLSKEKLFDPLPAIDRNK